MSPKLSRAFTRSKCESINEMVESLKPENETLKGDANGGMRICELRSIPQPFAVDNEFNWVYEQMQELFIDVNSKYFNFDILGIGEPIQHATYEDGGHYDWHVDIDAGNMSVRKLTAIVMLEDRDSFNGGGFEFQTGNPQKVDMDIGDAIFFPSFLLNRVNTVVSGKRRTIEAWASGFPYR